MQGCQVKYVSFVFCSFLLNLYYSVYILGEKRYKEVDMRQQKKVQCSFELFQRQSFYVANFDYMIAI